MIRPAVQAIAVASFAALATFLMIVLAVPRGLWHIVWMILLPLSAGIACNRGWTRWKMALVLPGISIAAVACIGGAMGGV